MLVIAAIMPGKCADPPAPAIITDILFFSAFFAQFIDVHSPVSMKLSLALIATLVDISLYVFVSYLISQSQYTNIFKGREEYVSKGFSYVLIGSSLYFLVALLT